MKSFYDEDWRGSKTYEISGLWLLGLANETLQKVKIKISLGEKGTKSLDSTGREARFPEYCLTWLKIY